MDEWGKQEVAYYPGCVGGSQLAALPGRSSRAMFKMVDPASLLLESMLSPSRHPKDIYGFRAAFITV